MVVMIETTYRGYKLRRAYDTLTTSIVYNGHTIDVVDDEQTARRVINEWLDAR